MKEKIVFKAPSYEMPVSLKEFIALLEEKLKEIPEEKRDEAEISIEPDVEWYTPKADIEISYFEGE